MSAKAKIELPGRAAQVRRGKIAKIHVARKQLRLDEPTYRAVLERVTGKTSAGEMSPAELDAVLSEFARLGFEPAPARGARATRPLTDSPHHRMMRGLWVGLVKAGAIEDGSERALAAFAENITGVAALAWLMPTQVNQVIEALKQWTARVADAERNKPNLGGHRDG